MIGACSSGGTGFTFFDINQRAQEGEEYLVTKTASGEKRTEIHKVACKTGTAEKGEDSEPHAWFTFFAPADEPEIVVTVLVENGGEGSSVAGPIAREIYDEWFEVD
jgi:cell division protein FtsI/penicillin-binding protein 2